MFLRRIRIKNMRAISELDLSFESSGTTDLDEVSGSRRELEGEARKWTLLLGENGCGKTTLLRAAALILAGSDALAELLQEPDSWIREGATECEIAIDFCTKKNEDRHASLVFSRGQKLKDIFSRNRQSMDRLDAALEHTTRSYMVCGYGASRRLTAGSKSVTRTSPFKNVRSQAVGTMFSNDAELNPLQEWAVDLHYRKENEGLRLVEDVLKDLLPGLKFKEIDRSKRELIFETPDGDVPLSRLSDGYQNMAGWCGDLLYRITSTFEDYNKPLEARGVLLIDEIDLHLHPVWQRKLRDFLDKKLPKFQVVATTHSALTAQQCGEGELYFLRRPDTGAAPRLEPFLGTPRKLLIHQFLLSPQFGLETVDSRSVEELKNEYRKLKRSKSLTNAQKDRLSAIASQLKNLPEWFDSPSDAALQSSSRLKATATIKRAPKRRNGKG
jgi:predicted ATP-dependent endonuclease of OLD family